MAVAVPDHSLRWQLLLRYMPALLFLGAVPHLHRVVLGCVALATSVSLGVVAHVDEVLAVKQAFWYSCGGMLVLLLQLPGIMHAVLRRADLLLFGSVVALVVALVWGTKLGGARSWLVVGTVSFQPVEMVKITLPMYWALAVSGPKSRRNVTTAVIVSVIVGLTLVGQRDIGPLVLFVAVALSWLWITVGAGRLFWHIAVAVTVPAGAAVVMMPHIARRFVAWLRPELDVFGVGYQTLSMRATLAEGGIFGNGWGPLNGNALPAAATDLPHIALTRHLGAAGFFCVVLLLAVMIRHLFLIVQNKRCPPGQRVAFVGAAWIAGQTVLSLSGGSGALPLIGLTLPFVSYGGTATAAVFIQLGMLVWLSATPGVADGAQRSARLCSRRLAGLRTGVMWLLAGSCILVAFYAFGYRGPTGFPAAAARPSYAANGAGITDRNGEMLLAITEGKTIPVVPSLVHVLGYDHVTYGITGLQATHKGINTAPASVWGRRFFTQNLPATPLRTTLDLRLQHVAEMALAEQTGAVVVLDIWQGDVLAVVSNPRFDMAGVSDAMDGSIAGAPLLNRAFQGRYAPGSVFKPVVLAAALEAGLLSEKTLLRDPIRLIVEGYPLTNSGNAAYGNVFPETALALSVNTIFAQLALDVGAERLRHQAALFGIGERDVKLEVPFNTGHLGAMSTRVMLAASGIGQGDVVVTPLEMAIVAAAVGNGGFRVAPRLTLSRDQRADDAPRPTRIMSETTSRIIANGMRLAMVAGTGAGNGDPRLLAGKTGTAEVNGRRPHAWFIGFAPADHPRIAFAVVLEHAGPGGKYAAPIGAAIARAYVQQTVTLPRMVRDTHNQKKE